MTRLIRHIPLLRRFRRDERGVALVEFAIGFPLLLMLFAVIVEGGRMFWAFQAANTGVREAVRYLTRVAPIDSCDQSTDFSAYNSDLLAIVRDNVSGTSIFPPTMTVTSVTASYTCDTSGSFRTADPATAQVTAIVQVTFPFATIFQLFGGSLGTMNATVTDRARVIGT